MSQQIIDIGDNAGVGGDDLRVAFDKVNQNFTEVYSGGVTAANVRVYSVAGRIGNVVLTAQDILGVATYANITALQQNIDAAVLTAQNYTDNSIMNLGPLPSVQITGGTISGVHITNSYATLANLTVTGVSAFGDDIQVNGSVSVQDLVVGQHIAFDDNTTQTTAFQGFGNIFTVAAGQADAISTLSDEFSSVQNQINTLTGNLVLVDNTIYVSNPGGTITLQPDGLGSVYIGQSGANDLVLGKGVWFDDGTYQDTAFIPGNSVTPADLSSAITETHDRIAAANAAIAINTNRVAAANASISALAGVVTAQAISDAANVTAANAHITSLSANAVAQATLINLVNANVAAANSAISTNSSDIAVVAGDVANLQSDLVDTNNYIDNVANDLGNFINTSNANAAVQGAAIQNLQSGLATTNSNVADADAAIAALQEDVSSLLNVDNNQDDFNAQILADVTAANAAILSVSGRVSAANLELGKLRANITAANSHIATNTADILQLSSDLSDVVLQVNNTQDGLDATNVVVAHNSGISNAQSAYANVQINSLINSVSDLSNGLASTDATVADLADQVTALGGIDIASLEANLVYANAMLLNHSSRITYSNILINALRANVTSANAHIASLESSISGIQSSVDSVAAGINDLYSNAAVQSAALFVLQANALSQQNSINSKANSLNPALAGIVEVTGSVNVSNAVQADSVTAVDASFDNIEGVLVTGAQPNITSLGTLDGLDVAGDITAYSITAATGLHGIVQTADQPFITNVGVLNSLIVDGVITTATLQVDTVDVSIDVITDVLTANTVSGLLTTASQTNVTQLGNLVSLVVEGNTKLNNLNVSGNITANAARSTLSVNSVLSNVVSASRANVTLANITAIQGVSGVWTGDVTANTFTTTYDVTAARVVATDLAGTLSTAAQPNITSVGTLTGLVSTGNVNTSANANVTGNVSANWVLANVMGRTATFAGNVITGNLNSAYIVGVIATPAQPGITTIGNLQVLNVDGDINLGGNLVLASATSVLQASDGVFGNVYGTLRTAAQPNITSLGVLTSLDVDGPVRITGSEFIAQDFYVTGNLFVQGNTTTIDATTVTTDDKNLILANGATSGTIARGAGIFVGNNGAFGNLTIYDGEWNTPNDLRLPNLYAGNVFATELTGTLQTASQTNITAVGTLNGLTVTGTTATDSLSVTNDGTFANVITGNVTTTDLYAFNARATNFAVDTTFQVGSVLTVPTITFSDGTTQTTSANNAVGPNLAMINANVTSANVEIGNLQSNIAAANVEILSLQSNIASANVEIGNLQSNIAAANVEIGNLQANLVAANAFISYLDANLGVATTDIQTLFSNAATQEDEINSLQGNIFAANLEIAGLQANLFATNLALSSTDANVAYANSILRTLAVSINPTFTGTLTAGNIKANANLISGGTVSGGNTTIWNNAGVAYLTTQSANLYINNYDSGAAGNVIIQGNLEVQGGEVVFGNVGALNVNATQGTFTSVQGTLLTAAQPNITSVGTLTNLNVANTITSANLSVGNISVTNGITLGSDINLPGNLVVHGNSQLANASVTGNVTAGANLYVGQTADITGNASAYALRLNGTTIDQNIQTGYVYATGTATVIGLATLGNVVTGNIQGANAHLSSADTATSTNSGALTVVGGIGIGGNAWIGGSANIGGDLTVSGVTAQGPAVFENQVNFNYPIIETTAPAIALFNAANTDQIIFGASAIDIQLGDSPVFGDAGQGNVNIRNSASINGNLHANGNAIIRSTVDSIGQYTGALQVFGGASIAANTYIGGNTYITGNTGVTGNLTVTNTPGYEGNAIATNGNISANSIFIADTVYANSVVVAGGIGIPNIDNTPIGGVTPSTGSFTQLTFTKVAPRYPRPVQRPTLMLDFANNPVLDTRIKFSRNSTATYIDATGNLIVAGSNDPRFTHDPSTNRPLGLLVEESRTNLFKYSADFTNSSYWTAFGATVAATGGTTSPTGNVLDAVEIVEDSGTHLHCVYPDVSNNQATLTNGNYYTASAFVKAGSQTQVSIIFLNEGSAPVFDLQTGGLYIEGTSYSSQMQNFGNGWYRISTTVAKTNTSGNVIFALATGGVTTYAGSGSVGAYIYGAQLEAATFATSYIPTTSTAVTRNAEVVRMDNAELGTWYDNQAGMLYVDALIENDPTVRTGGLTGTLRPTFVSIEGSSVDDRIAMVAENKTLPAPFRAGNLVIYSGGVLQANIGTTQTNFVTENGRFAAYFKANLIAATTNGNLAVSQTTGSLSSNLNTVYFGSGTATNYLNGTISKVMYYARAATAGTSEIIGLTQQ